MKRLFSKDGHVTTATSPAQAVRLAFDGWQEIHPPAEPDAPVEGAKEEPTRKRNART